VRLCAILLAGALAAAWPVQAQQVKLNFDRLEGKASNVVDLALNSSTLQFAARFLDSDDPDEAQVKKLIAGIQGIYVKSFEFKTEGVWSQADLDAVRNQLRAPEWTRMIRYKSAEEGENAEVYVRSDKDKITGVTIINAAPRELIVVNIAGAVDMDSLARLSGHFGLPKLETTAPPPKGKKD
jgi:hypothetical protein